MGPDAGPEPRGVRNSQKCLGSRRHSLRRQAINLTPQKKVKAWGAGPLRLEEINHPARMPDSLLKSLSTKQELIKRYFLTALPNGQVWHKAFFKVGPDVEPEPRRVRHSQKCLGPRWHSPKEGRLRGGLKPRGTAPWCSRKLAVWHKCQRVCWKSLCTKQELIKLPSYCHWETYIGSLLHSCKLGKLIYQYHYISLKHMGLMLLVGLVLLEIVSFSGLFCSPWFFPVFISLGDLDLSHTDL